MDSSINPSNSQDPDNPLIPIPPQSQKSAVSTSSPFPRPSLTRTRTKSRSPERFRDDLCAPDAAAALAGVHTPDTKMDGAGQRRRRSSLMNNLDTTSKSKRDTRSPKTPTKVGIRRDSVHEGLESGDRERLAGERQHSDEDRSASEDVELDDLSDEEDGLQDDEETGLTGKNKGRRKRKRRRNTLLDQRVAADVTITAEEKKEADQNVVKNLLINGLLIGLWYLFSLSISIVSPQQLRSLSFANVWHPSITNGCSIRNTLISTSRYSQPACTCSCNSPLRPWFSSSCHNSDLDTTPSRIHTIHIPMRNCCDTRRNPRNP
jgi:hypothetical protein